MSPNVELICIDICLINLLIIYFHTDTCVINFVMLYDCTCIVLYAVHRLEGNRDIPFGSSCPVICNHDFELLKKVFKSNQRLNTLVLTKLLPSSATGLISLVTSRRQVIISLVVYLGTQRKHW